MSSTSAMHVSRHDAGSVDRVRRSIDRVFRVSVHVLAGTASVMLAAAEGTPFPTLLTIPVAVVAAILTGERHRLHLSNGVANLCGVLAIGFAGAEFFGGAAIDSRLRAGVHLLVYLTWIVLLQQRTVGQYWWICALTVLQVAVGTLLVEQDDSSRYGVALIGYALLATWTLTVFSVQRAFNSGGVPEGNVGASGTTSYSGLRARSRTGERISGGERDRLLGGRFLSGVVFSTMASLVIAGVVFVFFPRGYAMNASFGSDRSFAFDQPALTGFSESVKLGEMGTILESNEKVLEVRTIDVDTGQEVDLFAYARRLGYDEPLLRGKVLDYYEQGQWTAEQSGRRMQFTTGDVPGAVRQEYRLSPIGTSILFVMQPARRVVLLESRERTGAIVLSSSSVVQRTSTSRGSDGVEYVAFSPRAAGPDAVVEPDRPSPRRRYRQIVSLLQRPPLPRLESFVEDELEEMRAGRLSPAEVADRFTRYLQSEGGFTYTLEGERVPRGADPVEHFLFERRSGHCEYYASALALMLRSVNVPARVVNGFKGATHNTLTGYDEVQQRHAHAWVEAYITDEPIELILRSPSPERINDGRWVVLDPTPGAARSESVASQAESERTFARLGAFLKDQWDWYVLRMTSYKQNDQFYRPVREFFTEAWRTARGDEASRKALWERIRALVSTPERWFSPVGFVVTFVGLFLAYGFVRLGIATVRILKRIAFGPPQSARRPVVEFYERFLRICRRLGLERRPSQTHREFAVEVSDRLAKSSAAPVDLEAVVTAFEDVRFGGIEPAGERTNEITSRLDSLATAVDEINAARP